MIGTLAVSNTAFRQNVKLQTFYAFLGSPSNIRVRDLPANIGDWDIDAVYVKVDYPDNTQYTVECVNVDDVWVGTVPASTTIGISQNGYQILADGTDEKGVQRVGYVLGAGDLEILDNDRQTAPGEHQILLSLKDDIPSNPQTGDICKDSTDGLYKIYQNEQWNALGQSSGGAWGVITGDISAQTDLMTELDTKRDKSDLSVIVPDTPWVFDKYLSIKLMYADGEGWYPASSDGEQIGQAKGDAQSTYLEWTDYEWSGGVSFNATRKLSYTDKIALTSDVDNALSVVADKRDKSDLSYDTDEYSDDWECTPEISSQGYHIGWLYGSWTVLDSSGEQFGMGKGTRDSTELKWLGSTDWAGEYDFTAKRLHVKDKIALTSDIDGVLKSDDVQPVDDESLTKVIATIGGKEIKAPEGGSSGATGYIVRVHGDSGYIWVRYADGTEEKVYLNESTEIRENVVAIKLKPVDNGITYEPPYGEDGIIEYNGNCYPSSCKLEKYLGVIKYENKWIYLDGNANFGVAWDF